MTVTGELMDHMPSLISANSELDPKQGELRVVSPVLIRDQRVVFDFEGFNGTVTEKDWAFRFTHRVRDGGYCRYLPWKARCRDTTCLAGSPSK